MNNSAILDEKMAIAGRGPRGVQAASKGGQARPSREEQENSGMLDEKMAIAGRGPRGVQASKGSQPRSSIQRGT